jgi:triphosphoribosyl-dephospho-CoA synthase
MTPCLRPAESYRAPHPRALADCAVAALIDEACLTPKPALVDQRGSGAHGDLDLDTMHRSARALHPAFLAIARVSALERPTQALRERLGRIGRDGEHAMLRATNGSNAHRGAIWIVGLLCAGAAMTGSVDSSTICAKAACVARFDDRFVPPSATSSNGARVAERYGVAGARGEATNGFPHVHDVGLPALQRARAAGLNENDARLEALISIIASLDDTCVLHRGGRTALDAAQYGARRVLESGGIGNERGRAALADLERCLLALNASPGGAADLIAATIFLDTLPRLSD